MESPTGGERALPSPVLHVNMSLFLQRKHEKLLAMVEARLLDAETEEELHRAQALVRLLEEARKATLRIAAEEEEPPVVQEVKQTTEVTAAPPPAKETPGTCPDATATTPPTSRRLGSTGGATTPHEAHTTKPAPPPPPDDRLHPLTRPPDGGWKCPPDRGWLCSPARTCSLKCPPDRGRLRTAKTIAWSNSGIT